MADALAREQLDDRVIARTVEAAFLPELPLQAAGLVQGWNDEEALAVALGGRIHRTNAGKLPPRNAVDKLVAAV